MSAMQPLCHLRRAALALTLALAATLATAQPKAADDDSAMLPSLQQLAASLLKGRQGAVVAIAPATGRVLCMVSATQDNSHINRAITGIYAPGSTFKTAQALVVLSEGVLDSEAHFDCQQGFTVGRTRVGCHQHAAGLGVVGALAQSCNTWFCQSMRAMIGDRDVYESPWAAMNRWHELMSSLGFGHRLGIDLANEAGGEIPDGQRLSKKWGSKWDEVQTMYLGMGQGPMTVTPLQLANLAAIIANGGYYHTPYAHLSSPKRSPQRYAQRHRALVSAEALALVARGMRAAVTQGTCRPIHTPAVALCGKTGTVENRGRDHSAFIGYAPADKPRIAVAVMVEQAGFGADVAAPIGAKIMRNYLGK